LVKSLKEEILELTF